MIIAVASGKGGTGKTTIAVNLALSIGKLEFIDCDVEEPNAHLFLKPEIVETKPVYTMVPEFDFEKCNYCGECSKICAYNALSVLKYSNGEKPEGDILFFAHLCHGCGGCVLLCPEKAIKEGKREIGVISIGKKGDIRFIEGRLNVSEVLAPAVIEEARSLVDAKRNVVIIDAPPGSACPVVASLRDVDFCILVTEPTPFGLHDLEIAYEVTKVLNVPSGVVINKSGDDGIIENFCKERNIPILMKIPFDREIARAYAEGKALVEVFPEYKEKFLEMFERIRGQVK